MSAVEIKARLSLRSLIFLTDFSEPSEAALPFALALAREYGATIHALHVLVPEAYLAATPESSMAGIEAQEEYAQVEMQRTDSSLAGVAHDVSVVRGTDVWPVLRQVMATQNADMIVLGTHGRTGAQKFLLGSVAEEVFRQSEVPVMTIGPRVQVGRHSGARFHHVLYATDFTPESRAAAPYAVSIAQENQAQLILFHAIHGKKTGKERPTPESSVAHALHELLELVQPEGELWCRPEPVVKYGEPAAKVLAEAAERHADLIVLGVRNAAGRLGAATHLERSVAHRIVVNARCPVLTVRG
ncbi:MAG TPA: universal stress protein [Candidatus Binatia bacterium]|nr:universal stress protein [Candidatus Binatia bacterium]